MKNEKFWWIGSPRGVQVAARFPGGMRASRPTHGFGIVANSCGFAMGFPLFVGAGFIPPADVSTAANFPGRYEHRPLRSLHF